MLWQLSHDITMPGSISWNLANKGCNWWLYVVHWSKCCFNQWIWAKNVLVTLWKTYLPSHGNVLDHSDCMRMAES